MDHPWWLLVWFRHHKQGFDLLHSMILLYVYNSMILHRTGSNKTPIICLQYSPYVQLQQNLHENTLSLLIKQKKRKNQCYTLLNHERLQEHKIFQLSQPVKFFLQQGVTSAELRSTGYGVYNPNPLLLSFDPFFTISSIVLVHLTLDECSLV